MLWWILTAFVVAAASCAAVGAAAASPSPADLPAELEALADKPKRCTYQHVRDLYGVQCRELNWSELSQKLKYGIEILDASYNRIRALRNNSFERYTSLRYLYLSDNVITIIEPLAFEPLGYLEVLDLTLNGLTTIPPSILNLDSLRKLYMAKNFLHHLEIDLKSLQKPIRAPLEFLDISECELKNIPDFGIMSALIVLDVSNNDFRHLDVSDFARTCRLKTLDLTGSCENMNICTIKPLSSWFLEKRMNVTPPEYMYSEEYSNCPAVPLTLTLETQNVYKECTAIITVRRSSKSAKQTWVIIVASLGGFLVGFLLLLYLMHWRNVQQTKYLVKMKNNKVEVTTEDAKTTATANLLSVS